MSLRPIARTRTHDLRAPVVFGVFTILGCAYIATSKLLGVGAFQVTTVPVALMFGYAGMVVAFKGLRLRDDQTGDNLYYMGFIFTLSSLAVSLYQYSSDASVTEIIKNFGIAVATTIAGITLRIFFNQMRRDPVEVEVAARIELSDAARRVRRELDNVTQELAHFRRTNQQMIDEGYSEALKQIEQTGSKTAEMLRSVAEAGAGSVTRSAEAAGNDLVEATNKLSFQLQKSVGQIENLGSALDAIVNV